MTHSDSKIVTARKPHTCDDCNGKINVGDKYRYSTCAVFKEDDCEKSFDVWKYCPSCEQKHEEEREEQRKEMQAKIEECEKIGHDFKDSYGCTYDSGGTAYPDYEGTFCTNCGIEKPKQ